MTGRKLDLEIVQRVVELRKQCIAQKLISQQVGIPIDRVRYICQQAGIKFSVQEQSKNDPRKLSSDVVEQIIKKHKENVSHIEIAKELNIKLRQVKYIIGREGAGISNAIPDDIQAKIVELRLQGLALSEIANKLNIDKKQVGYVCGRHKIVLTSEQRLNNTKRADPELVEKLIDLRQRQFSLKEIARELGITRSTAKNLLLARGITIPVEARIANSTAGYHRNKDYIVARQREGVTPEVLAKMSKSVRETYKNNPEIGNKISEKLKQFHRDNPMELKYGWAKIQEVVDARKMKWLDPPNFEERPPPSNGNISLICHCGTTIHKVNIGDFVRGRIRSCGCIRSHQEARIRAMIQEWFPNADKNTELLGGRELDIYIPEKNIAIEYNGLFVHSDGPWCKDKYAASTKFEQAKNLGIRLITIFSDEWLNREPVVIGYLRAILGISSRTVFARQCEITTDRTAVLSFVNKNHIQGCEVKGLTSFFGLVYKGEIVAALIGKKNELSRYCLAPDLKVVGGFDRLLHHFIQNLNGQFSSMITFSDNRWSWGEMYERRGFKPVDKQDPIYYYIKGDRIRHRFNFRKENIKKHLGPLEPGETEAKAMERFGFYRIWDCGKIKWELDLTENRYTSQS